jgi:hypothetical protein
MSKIICPYCRQPHPTFQAILYLGFWFFGVACAGFFLRSIGALS